MKKIYIIQMHTGTFPSKIVKVLSCYPYSHVGISLDQNCETIYSFGRKSLYNFLNGGFVKQKSTDIFYQKYNKTLCRIYELQVTSEQLHALKRILEEFEKNTEQYKYDFVGLILRNVLHLPVVIKHHYVCSHFVAEMLYQIGYCDLIPYQMQPKDFEWLSGVKQIYYGRYPIILTNTSN